MRDGSPRKSERNQRAKHFPRFNGGRERPAYPAKSAICFFPGDASCTLKSIESYDERQPANSSRFFTFPLEHGQLRALIVRKAVRWTYLSSSVALCLEISTATGQLELQIRRKFSDSRDGLVYSFTRIRRFSSI